MIYIKNGNLALHGIASKKGSLELVVVPQDASPSPNARIEVYFFEFLSDPGWYAGLAIT